MRLKAILTTAVLASLLFAGCNDSKKKEAEAQAQAEERMLRERDSLAQIEEENTRRMADMENNSISARAMANNDLSTLAGAIQSAELDSTLRAEGEYTVFAPTNEAFNKVPKSTLDNLMKPENNEQLQNLLKYHVVQGKMTAADLMAKIKDAGGKLDLTTLNGEVLTLSEKDGKIMIKDSKGNTAAVTNADEDASNGVIHVVDKVLMP